MIRNIYIKKVVIFALFLVPLFSVNLDIKSSANGSISAPFTSLAQAGPVKVAGKYYFNIGGKTFATQVNTQRGGGWVMIGGGNFATNETEYATSTNLDLRSDKMLPADVVSVLTDTAEVRINSTNKPNLFDVVTNNSIIKSRLLNYTTLAYNTLTDELKPNWWGFDPNGYLNRNASGACVGTNQALNKSVIVNCGNNSGLRWVPSSGLETINNVAKNDNLHLWVRAVPNKPIKSVRLNYTGVATSYTIMNQVRILDQTGAYYSPNQWIITDSHLSTLIGTILDPSSQIRAPVNAPGWILIEPVPKQIHSGFRGFSANYRQDASSTRFDSIVVTHVDGTTRTQNYFINPFVTTAIFLFDPPALTWK